MVTINPDDKIVTFINTFTVAPENQEKLIALLQEGAEKVIRHMDGFISVTLHKGLDGTQVANYAQWKSKEQCLAVFQNAEALAYLKRMEPLILKVEPLLYEVVSSQETEGAKGA